MGNENKTSMKKMDSHLLVKLLLDTYISLYLFKRFFFN